jgi:hypothetical protein
VAEEPAALSEAKHATHLVQTPRITVKEHLHTIVQHRRGLLLGHQGTFTVRARFRLESLAEEGLGDVGAETRREGRGRVGRSEEVDVAEESGCESARWGLAWRECVARQADKVRRGNEEERKQGEEHQEQQEQQE